MLLQTQAIAHQVPGLFGNFIEQIAGSCGSLAGGGWCTAGLGLPALLLVQPLFDQCPVVAGVQQFGIQLQGFAIGLKSRREILLIGQCIAQVIECLGRILDLSIGGGGLGVATGAKPGVPLPERIAKCLGCRGELPLP